MFTDLIVKLILLILIFINVIQGLLCLCKNKPDKKQTCSVNIDKIEQNIQPEKRTASIEKESEKQQNLVLKIKKSPNKDKDESKSQQEKVTQNQKNKKEKNTYVPQEQVHSMLSVVAKKQKPKGLLDPFPPSSDYYIANSKFYTKDFDIDELIRTFQLSHKDVSESDDD